MIARTWMLPWLLALAAKAQGPTAGFEFLRTPPPGLPPMPAPPGPAPTADVFALGQQLFADPILSRDLTVSCQSCHLPAHGFASPERRPAGVEGRRPARHAPALINRGYGRSMRWDGRTPTLEEFVLQPIRDPDEMDLPLAEALARLSAHDGYRQRFAAAFARGTVDEANLATALATFVRGIVAGDAPIDRFQRGAPDSLTPAQRAGLWIFESKGACWRCHTMPLFTDERFHNTGVGVRDGQPEPGRAAHTEDPADTGRFKTPTLRSVRLSAPYMHDGSIATLAEVVEFYVRGGKANAHLSPLLGPLSLSAEDRRNLVLFLETL